MAAYATIAEVTAEFKNLDLTKNTLVTRVDVDRFVTEASALINTYVGAKYAVPIAANEDSVALMRFYTIVLVADRIKAILENRQTTNVKANQEVRGAFGTKEVMKALNDIKEGKLILNGATQLAGSGAGVFYSDNYANSREAVFKKDSEQW